jgi:uncharacterized protein (DUF58 family)
VFFALTFGVGFAALNTGNNLLYLVLSLMLAFLVLSGVLSEAALRGISVKRRLPRELFAETPGLVSLEISNQQRRVPAIAIVVEDLAREGDRVRPAGRCFVLRVAPNGSEQRFYRLRAPRRGELRLHGFRVSTRFPFGLFSKSLALDAPESTVVYPAIEALDRRGAARGERLGESARPQPAPGGEVSGLRDFRSGDALRRIHWRATLRRGSLVVRESESDRRGEHEVRLRTRDAAPGDAFETAVRRAASEVVAWLEAGARVALRTDGARFAAEDGAAQRARLLGFLARVEPEGSAQ